MEHVPVLLEETLELLAPQRGGLFVDCTLGLGGHAGALLERFGQVTVVGIDRDPQALEVAASRLSRFGDRVSFLEGNFSRLGDLLDQVGVAQVSGILADLGVSSLQLERPERGFSFRLDGPLDMRMGGGELTAHRVVNRYSEANLERIFREYGEERQARRIARAIIRARGEVEIRTTAELQAIIRRARGRHQRSRRARLTRIDPATRVFQALRIEVNQELAGLRKMLDQAMGFLETDGRIVVISYQSLEDRIVKGQLQALAQGEVDPITGRPLSETRAIEILTKKPVRPKVEEVDFNPRSRSARLRAARRL